MAFDSVSPCFILFHFVSFRSGLGDIWDEMERSCRVLCGVFEIERLIVMFEFSGGNFGEW